MRLLLVFLLILLAPEVEAHNLLVNNSAKKPKRVKLFAMGGDMGKYRPNDCQAQIDQKYGLTIKYFHGCVITKYRRWRINTAYRKANQKLTKRIGPDWKERYFQEIQVCN